MTDATFSPWPAPGKWFEFRNREAVAVEAEPPYDKNYPSLKLEDLNYIKVTEGKYWFFTMNTGWFHFYYGARPVTMDDPGFYYSEHPEVVKHRGKLFVEPHRIRWGFGGIS